MKDRNFRILVLKGFKFGLILQLAVGPMCLIVFQTATAHGFIKALSVVFAITLIDAFYIACSCVGVAAVMNRPGVQKIVKSTGCIVLVFFGINTISSAFHLTLLPDIVLFPQATGGSLFIKGIVLTASNPLTIIFWSGMFSTQMIENNWRKEQLFFFAAGCVMATIGFLTGVSFLGSIASGFLPPILIQVLNVAVGFILIGFGIRLLMKKDNTSKTDSNKV